MSRALAYGLGLSVALATLAPALSNPTADSYPFSTYPMFTARRETAWVHQALALRGGARTVLPPSVVTGGTEVMQAAATLKRAVEADRDGRQRLCRDVARRAAKAARAGAEPLDGVELVASEFDTVGYFTGRREPVSRRVLVTCSVEGAP